MVEVYAVVGGRRRDAHKHADGYYKCFPRSCNRVSDAKLFTELRDAAVFLLRNPDWGIRMQPGMAIIYDGVQIIRR